MNFSVIIWGSVASCVVILVPLFSIYFIFDCLNSLFRWTDK